MGAVAVTAAPPGKAGSCRLFLLGRDCCPGVPSPATRVLRSIVLSLRPARRSRATRACRLDQPASNILKALWALLWPLAGAIAVGAYLHAPTALRASQSDHDTAAPVLVPLFLLAMIGIGAGASVLTGLAWWALLRRRFMAAALLNLALWAAFLGFAQSPSGQAFIRSRQAPVTQSSPSAHSGLQRDAAGRWPGAADLGLSVRRETQREDQRAVGPWSASTRN